jgi:hypothetical protein
MDIILALRFRVIILETTPRKYDVVDAIHKSRHCDSLVVYGIRRLMRKEYFLILLLFF